jgi:deazaflavin-dependent oxidoreductase (nitroreductase family)
MTFHRALTSLHSRYINRVAIRIAGRGSLADLEHVGRWSGTLRHSPLRAFRSRDTVVVALNFGRESDWLKNIEAAGRCRMVLRQQVLELGTPRILPLSDGARMMPPWFFLGLRYVVRTTDCVMLPIVSCSLVTSGASAQA